MNFFALQERARRRTGELIAYYGLAVALIIAVVYLILGFAFKQFHDPDEGTLRTIWNPDLFLYTAVGLLVVIVCGTLYQVAALSSGGSAVAEMLGGRLLSPETRDPHERRFLNVVEEMALASGVPVPKAYVLEEEEGINAFAAGVKPSDAVVAVTRGCLKTLNRDELQGVVAHEFSHILNGDMRLNLRLIGVLFGILLVSMLGYGMFRMAGVFGGGRRSSRDSKNNGGAAALAFLLAGLGIWLVGYIGVFFANLIKAAVSREREYLADASAVQFTRNPDGLAGALKKIGALSAGSRVQATRAAEASHLFFAEGAGHAMLNLTATHPPLIERIRRLDPAFDGKFDRIRLDSEVAADPAAKVARPRPAAAAGLAAAASAASAPAAPPAGSGVRMESLSGEVGNADGDYLDFVRQFVATLPGDLRDAAHTLNRAPAVAFALLVSQDDAVRARQLELLRSRCGVPCVQRTEALLPLVAQVPRNGRLPLGDLAMGTLRQVSKADYEIFRAAALALAGADEQVDLFEYAFLRLMVRRLDSAFGKGRKAGSLITRLAEVRMECGVLLGGLAHYGQEAERARQAFQKGMETLFPGEPAVLPPAAACALKQVDEALNRLADLRPTLKAVVLDACGRCAADDGRVTVAESDLLRAVADALDCPVPPLSLKAG